jgi:hypothetical protein
MKYPPITRLNIPPLMDATSRLSKVGRIAVSHNNLLYLDVDDAYIHELFPLLPYPKIKKPDYFRENGVGAHVSIVYPEEHWHHYEGDLGIECRFEAREAVIAEIDCKPYYVLLIDSPSLLVVRRKYGLSDNLNFKNHWIGFHITIARGS